MRYIFAVICLILVYSPSLAQIDDNNPPYPTYEYTWENVHLRYVCSSDDNDVYEVTALSDGEYTVSPYHVDSDSYNGDGWHQLDAGESYRHRVPVNRPGRSEYILAWSDQGFEGVVDAGRSGCDNETPEPEWWGVDCFDMTFPDVTHFVVDGSTYVATDGHVSWIPPIDVFWVWELYLSNGIIVVLEQTEVGNCRFVEMYPNQTLEENN